MLFESLSSFPYARRTLHQGTLPVYREYAMAAHVLITHRHPLNAMAACSRADVSAVQRATRPHEGLRSAQLESRASKAVEVSTPTFR